MGTGSLRSLLEAQLKDLYNIEIQMLIQLPRLKSRCASDQLYRALDEHEDVTNLQLKRLEEIGFTLAVELTGKTSTVMQSLIEEAEELLEENAPATVYDIATASFAQRIIHLEIAAYKSASSLADHLGLSRVYNMLLESLTEENSMNDLLAEIRKSELFPKNDWEWSSTQEAYNDLPGDPAFLTDSDVEDDYPSDIY
ncbi:MAG: DUF892 family protein [Bdellovibrionota bacterium]